MSQIIEYNTLPFQMMRYRYGVPILLLIEARGEMFQNEIRRELGSEWAPIKHAMEFLVENRFVNQKEMPKNERIRYHYTLTPKGKRIAVQLRICAQQLEHLCHENDEPHNHNRK